MNEKGEFNKELDISLTEVQLIAGKTWRMNAITLPKQNFNPNNTY